MSEFMGLVRGAYDAKAGRLRTRGGQPCTTRCPATARTGPVTTRAVAAELAPHRIADTMAFMFESRWVIRPTRWAVETPLMQLDYDEVWRDFAKGAPPR